MYALGETCHMCRENEFRRRYTSSGQPCGMCSGPAPVWEGASGAGGPGPGPSPCPPRSPSQPIYSLRTISHCLYHSPLFSITQVEILQKFSFCVKAATWPGSPSHEQQLASRRRGGGRAGGGGGGQRSGHPATADTLVIWSLLSLCRHFYLSYLKLTPS
jgi:hypothetical protein